MAGDMPSHPSTSNRVGRCYHARVLVRLITLIVSVTALAGTAAEPALILFNGKIVTVDGAFTYAQAVAIREGRFVSVGSDADVRRLAGPDTKLMDLRGRTVIPGLADNHLHSAGGGPGVDLSGARTLPQLLSAIADARVRTRQVN